MTDAAALVMALRAGRTWQRVADLCNDGTGILHSAGYYQQVATGRIQSPNDATREAITQAASIFSSFSASRTQDTRKTVHLYPEDWEAGNLERLRLGLTWPEMVHLWREKYNEEASE